MPVDQPPAIICEAPRAVDGDTIRCANLTVSVRLIGIDAPELPGHCRKGRACTPGDGHASRRALAALLLIGPVQIIPSTARDPYGRILAHVRAGALDLNCAQLGSGQAMPRYSPVGCSR